MRNRSTAFLAAGVLGVAAVLLGQAWGFYLHAVGATHQAPATGVAHEGSTSISVTAAQLKAAVRLYEQTKAAAEKYRDLRAAIAAGYQPMEPPDLEIAHYVNRAYFTDGDILKPEHIQSLIYYNSPKGPVLIGAMFIMPRL